MNVNALDKYQFARQTFVKCVCIGSGVGGGGGEKLNISKLLATCRGSETKSNRLRVMFCDIACNAF
jgi:hypothetical protein